MPYRNSLSVNHLSQAGNCMICVCVFENCLYLQNFRRSSWVCMNWVVNTAIAIVNLIFQRRVYPFASPTKGFPLKWKSISGRLPIKHAAKLQFDPKQFCWREYFHDKVSCINLALLEKLCSSFKDNKNLGIHYTS